MRNSKSSIMGIPKSSEIKVIKFILFTLFMYIYIYIKEKKKRREKWKTK